MSFAVKAIGKVLDAVVDIVKAVVDAITAVVETIWKAVLEPVLEFVLGLFGIEDEDIISTNVSVQRIIKDDEAIAAIMTKVCLEKQKDDSMGIMDRFLAHTKRVRARYNAYFKYGKNDLAVGLPEANLKAIKIDNELVKNVIDSVYGINCTILESKITAPNKYEYVYAKFHDLYGYKPYNNELPYLGDIYRITNIDYNYDLDRYDVYITSYEDRTTVVTTTTVVTITNIDATNDNKNTAVTRRTVVTGTKSGTISDDTVEVSNVNETIPKDSETGSTSNTVDTTTVYDVTYATTSIPIAAYNPTRHYIVKYWYVTASEWYYWIYEESSGAYPTLDNTNYRTTNLDMLPIVPLRNATINVNANKESVAYKQAKEILNYVGLDVDQLVDGISQNDQIANIEDAFVHFGINPNDQDPVISKMLYVIFEYIFDDAGLVVDGSAKGFTATIQEGPFNAAIAWASQSRVISDGVIGPLGSYKHSIVGKSLIVQKQEEPKKYVTITMNDMSSITLIDRQGLVGASAADVGHENFYIPLSIYLVNKLSPIEQTLLFNKSLILTIYAAQVQHLEWYETKAFGDFLQLVGIAIFLFSGFDPSTFFTMSGLFKVGAYMAGMLVLQEVLKSVDSPFIRVLVTLAAAYAMGGGFDKVNFEFVSPMALLDSVTNFCTALTVVTSSIGVVLGADMAELQVQQQQFRNKVETVRAEQEAAKAELYTPFGAAYTSNLKQIEEVSPYLYGVDAMMYRARDVQYNFDAMYDYDALTSDFVSNKLRLGVI